METLWGLQRTEELVKEPTVKALSVLTDTAFTRRREGGMEFPDALRFLLDMSHDALPHRLDRFYRQAKGGKAISQPAFTKLRAKFDHTPFEIILRDLVGEEYSGRHELPLWNGYHLFGIDGSYLQLPQEPDIIKTFGVRGGNKSGAFQRASAGISVLYDVLHGWALDPEIARSDRSERAAAARHIDFLGGELPEIARNTILLMDRGYTSYELLGKCEEIGLKFVIRCNSSHFKAANQCPLGDSEIVFDNGQTVRVVRFLLKNGEIETLLTNLFDLPEADFQALYALRWGVETYYHKLKQIVGVEQFLGRTTNSVRQDFWASQVMLLFAQMFQRDADAEIAKRQEPLPVKHLNRSRTSHIVVTLRDRFIFSALCGYPELASFEFRAVMDELARVVSPVRPGRSFPRVHRPDLFANAHLKSRL
jgi:hypothetical protein